MKIKELIEDYNGAMTAKYKSKLTTFRKIEYLKKKLYDEYPNQYRVEMLLAPGGISHSGPGENRQFWPDENSQS